MRAFTLTLFASILFLASATQAAAQVETPQPSPSGKISQKVGLADVTLEFSRPSARERVIFGDLVQYNDMWRLGANASTKITISQDATIGGVNVPKGTYSMFAIPQANEWTIIINKNTDLWGVDGYEENQDVARFSAPVTRISEKVETLTFDIGALTDNGGKIFISWENVRCNININFDTDSRVMASIKKTMDGPSAGDFYQAAGYYLSNNKDLKVALEWIDKAIAKNGEKFWYLRRKALIQAGLGDFKGAVATATRSTEVAKTEGNTDYPRMNDKNIAEWKTKIK